MQRPRYKRVLLKISGEALMGQREGGLDKRACASICNAIKEVHALGVELGIVIGGGNIFRGALAKEFGLARTPADQMGMLATAINGVLLQEELKMLGMDCRILSSFRCEGIFEAFNWERALRHLQKGRILIFTGGTGHPYFTTDTAAALRAKEINAEIFLKATKVSGVFSEDPRKNASAQKFDTLSYDEALVKNLKVMDATALALCRENKLPIYVFNLFEPGALKNAVCEQKGGTLVGDHL